MNQQKDVRTSAGESKIVASPSEATLTMSAASAAGPAPDADGDISDAFMVLERLKAASQVAEGIARYQVNHWVKPAGYEEFLFVRLLPRNYHNIKERERNAALEADLKRRGWRDAPRGTQFIGYESDGEYRRWLCIPRAVKEAIDAHEAEMMRKQASWKKDPVEQLSADFSGVRGVRVTEISKQLVTRR